MAYIPAESGGGKPYELSELSATGILDTRWTPIFGGWVKKNGICYIDGLFELIQDLSIVKTFPVTSQGYDIFSNLPVPKAMASVGFIGLMCKRNTDGKWYDQNMVVVKISPYQTLQLAQYATTPLTDGRFALRVVGQYYTE
jgi:hypothetical protein